MADTSSEQPGPNASLVAPQFVTFTNVTPDGADELEFVITNEATGKYFLANQKTVQFFAAVRETGSVHEGLIKSGILPQHGTNLVKRLLDAGLLVRAGETQSKADIKAAPIESKLISMRWDLFDSSRIVALFGWLGRLLYSPLGYLAWGLSVSAMVLALISNSEKVGLGLRQLLDASWYQLTLFALLYVVLKIVHEMGHALAYRTMCLRENLDPGPIRMGISIFAFTPFPFTDVTGAWRLRSIFRRMMIGAGGIYFETWAIAAFTLFWSQTQAGMLQTTILQVVVVAGLFAMVFNLNPAIKLDGYYMLTDYLRRPNLAGRASQAARSLVAKTMGANTQPIVGADLAYWVLSYAYRWTIFGGIFWLIYRFDPRLAPVAATIVFLTLIGRPLYNSVKYAITSGARPLRSILAFSILAGLAFLAFVPFPDRILMPGQMRYFETSFIEPPESGRLHLIKAGQFTLVNPVLNHQIVDLDLRRAMFENLQRAGAATGAENARLAAEFERFENSNAQLLARRATLNFVGDVDSVWTALDADAYAGSWVSPSAQLTLGALSTPILAQLRLRLDQGLLEQEVTLVSETPLIIRPVHNPSCSFVAKLTPELSDPIAVDGVLTISAKPVPANDICAQSVKHGGAVIARLETRPRSVVERIKIGVSRLLQNRLPIELK